VSARMSVHIHTLTRVLRLRMSIHMYIRTYISTREFMPARATAAVNCRAETGLRSSTRSSGIPRHLLGAENFVPLSTVILVCVEFRPENPHALAFLVRLRAYRQGTSHLRTRACSLSRAFQLVNSQSLSIPNKHDGDGKKGQVTEEMEGRGEVARLTVMF
jgi:hypothetical protein